MIVFSLDEETCFYPSWWLLVEEPLFVMTAVCQIDAFPVWYWFCEEKTSPYAVCAQFVMSIKFV